MLQQPVLFQSKAVLIAAQDTDSQIAAELLGYSSEQSTSSQECNSARQTALAHKNQRGFRFHLPYLHIKSLVLSRHMFRRFGLFEFE